MTKRLTIALIALVALVLVAVLPVAATYYDINNTVYAPGATIYIGEQQLNLSWVPVGTQVGWWASAAPINTTAPSQTLTITNNQSFYVSPTLAAYAGNWYVLPVGATPQLAFSVAAPSITVDVWDLSTGTTATGGSVIQGDYLAFRINSNLDQALNPAYREADQINTANTGNVDIKVKSASGNTYTAVFANTTDLTTKSITQQNVNLPSWFWGTSDGNQPGAANYAPNWSTGAVDSTGQNAYPAGVYTVIAQSRLNGMYDNYLNGGATYTGATVSQPAMVTITSNTVSLSANVDSVVRSKPFSVTITGKPGVTYHLFIKGTSSMDGTYDNQPPIITANQAGVVFDPLTGPDFTTIGNAAYPNAVNGNYSYQNGGGKSLWSYVAHGSDYLTAGPISAAIGNGTFIYANVTLDQTGTRTVQFSTTNWTKAQQYTVRVEQNFGGATGFKSDEVIVQVQKGAVTIVAAGSQSYYLGEEIQFSGTDTESNDVYLFITGPNLPTIGGQIQSLDPRNAKVADGDPTTFQDVAVNGDNTWSWQWGTSSVALDAGTYTVYAVSQPYGTDDLNDVAYGTVSIIIKKPFVSATASQSTVAQGDPVYVTGTAQGQPSLGVQIWILGKNFAMITTEAVNSDSSFSYELKGTDTLNMYAGQYFVVVQHPMQNGVFDVYASPALASPSTATDTISSYVYTAAPASGGAPTQDFALTGAGSLQGSDAAEALVQAINSPNVDDTYTKLQFLVETPVITINPVGDQAVGNKFTITATTNLAVGDNVLFTVYSSSFQPTDKTQSGEFSGASGTVAVTQGTNGLNALSFDVDASTFKPDEYLVTAQEVLQPQATGTALFNVLQAAPPTATPTPVATVTTVPTMVATPMPTTVAPTKTPTQPGFGALVALIGLGAVALLVVRRH
ncbi:MAG: MEMAR_RS02690 family S-layer glycoprotein [Methanoregula sp.]|uniref:MEMAR_RS02690 family S-layer glycoprotein n=1 Tax=Methanoregula sp. TaxID=2052170 RepID=UPI003C76D435